MHRAYHNMTSRYNGYFYAKENMKDALDQLDKSYIDDYSQILPVYRLPNTPETKGCYAPLEKAIKKSSSVIEHHAITTKGGDEIPGAVKWIDDNYLIIGRARYYKGEYISAIEIFDYLIQKYSKFPIRYDAIMWKARTEIEMSGLTEAEGMLDVIANDKGCPERLLPDIKATYAYLYIQKGNYNAAIKNLEEAIKITKSKKPRVRYMYVLAQLYEKTGKQKEAFDMYDKVIGMHPRYDMLFNAKLSRARLSASDPKTRNESKKELQKMLSDSKNTEFQDQIYYTLAQLEMGSKNEAGAVSYYKLSVASSVGNNKQKSLSYLALGDIYFGRTDYINAQAYYDSTMQFLPKDYPDYKSIDEKRKSLNNLVHYINLVAFEDSTQMVARKYGDDTLKLYPFIDKLIAKQKAEDKKKKEQQDALAAAGGTGFTAGQSSTNTQPSSFYFYNPSNISFGVNEFTRKWGNRKLEDNWRRSNKESIVEEESSDNQNADSSNTKGGGKKTVNDKYSRAYYIKDLPLNDSLVAASNERIADALFNLGTIYKEQMKNYPRSEDAFEELCKRFPKHKYNLPSHFQLYRIYSDQTVNNTAKAKEHSDYICNNFPSSEYCELIKNPDHEVDVLGAKKDISAYYDSTYSIYLRRDYQQVIARCNYADSVYGTKTDKNEMAAKFAYLRAVSIGKTQGIPQMETALTKIVANYPKDPIRPQVQALIDAIHKQNSGSTDVVLTDTASVVNGNGYKINDNGDYQFMIIVENGKGDVNKTKIAITDFDGVNYTSEGLVVSSMMLDDKHQCILVKKFSGKKSVMDYYGVLKIHPELFAMLQPGTFQVMAISSENFPVFFKDKNIDTYKAFFEKNILTGK